LFNFKTSGFAAGAAFVLSLVIGLISGVDFPLLLIRPLIFAAAFFALSCLVFWLLAQFLPEMLGEQDDDPGLSVPGSQVDISLDSPVEGAFPADNSESVDDIAGTPSSPARAASSPLDQGEEAGYNAKGEVSADLQDADGAVADIDSDEVVGRGAAKAEILPDMDKFAENAAESAGESDAESNELRFEPPEPKQTLSAGKKTEMRGDFNPKELAKAIQTVLKKEEKG